MRLDVKALTITCALLWGGAVLLAGVANLAWPPYGEAFLRGVASVYPGWEGPGGAVSVLSGTLYGLVDGGLAGFFLAWLYNRLAGSG